MLCYYVRCPHYSFSLVFNSCDTFRVVGGPYHIFLLSFDVLRRWAYEFFTIISASMTILLSSSLLNAMPVAILLIFFPMSLVEYRKKISFSLLAPFVARCACAFRSTIITNLRLRQRALRARIKVAICVSNQHLSTFMICFSYSFLSAVKNL